MAENSTDILEPLTDQQKAQTGVDVDAKELRIRTIRMKALKELEARQATLKEQGKLMCYRCAKLDYEEAQKKAYENPITRTRYAKELKEQGLTMIERNMPIAFDSKPYEDQKTFRKLKVEQVKETTKIAGVKATYVTTYETYKCLRRGCGIALQISEELDSPDKRVGKR